MHAAIAVAPALWALVACGVPQGTDPTPHPDVTADQAEVRLVDDDQANFVLHASNQSFDDDEVRLTIEVDGVTVVDDDFHVEDQHNWVAFALKVSPGVHEVTAKSDSGATLRESFRVPADKKRHAAIDYWGEDDSAELTWLIQRHPLAFA